MRPLIPYTVAFFADALLRRALTYAVVLYGAGALGSGQWAGALYMALMLPYLVSWYAGVVIDAGAQRETLRAASAAIAMLTIALAAATASAFAYPAFFAALPRVAGANNVVTATVVLNALSLATYVLGPVTVGVLRAV